MGITLQGFFRCPCGKLHTYSGIDGRTQCPQCGRGLFLVAIQPEPVSTREVMARLNAPRTGSIIERIRTRVAESENAPRLRCGMCQFEYLKGNPERHTCN